MIARALVIALGLVLASAPARADKPAPAIDALITGTPARGAALDPVFARFTFTRMKCAFSEDKHVALLAKPLRSSGTIVFDRGRGVARITAAPRPSRAVLTAQSLRLITGQRSEEIPLDKMRDLKAFALIFPSLLRGDRGELERSFELGLYGDAKASWAVTLVPKADALRKLVRRVVVAGRGDALVAFQISEASGDTTDTQLADVVTDAKVADAEIAAAFGAP